MKKNVAEIVTAKIIKSLESGSVPWHKPWGSGIQASYTTKKAYSGINQWILQLEADEKGYKSNHWLTYKQAEKLGSLKGQKSVPIVFWSITESTEKTEDDKPKTYAFLRYYNVFNAEQVEGLKLPDKKDVEIKPEPEKIISEYFTREAMELREELADRAFYSPKSDYIQIPTKEQFDSTTDRYSTLYHEMVHSTGHEKRLKRFTDTTKHNFGSQDYSKEELIAELGASMLCHLTGITPNWSQSGAYIKSWLKVLNNDKNLIITASSKADKASKYILGE